MATDSRLDPKIFAAEDMDKKIPPDVGKEILRAVVSIAYGSVEIVIHKNRVVQIECREKIRVDRSDSRCKTI